MVRKILLAIVLGLLVGVPSESVAAAIHPVGEEEAFVVDGRVTHLPQKLRQPALDFYRDLEKTCRGLSGTEDVSLMNGAPHASFVDHYAPLVGDSPLENRLVRFLDWIVAEDGIGSIKIDGLSDEIEPHMVNLHVEGGVGVIPADQVDFFKRNFLPMICDLAGEGNSVAQYIRGLMRFHGIGEPENVDSGRRLLLVSARGHYGRAADFLQRYGDYPAGYIPREIDRLNRLLGEDDPVDRYLKHYIDRRSASTAIADRQLDGLKEVLTVLPGNTSRLLGVYSNLSRVLEERFLERHIPGPTVKGVMAKVYSTVVFTTAAGGYFWWGSQEKEWWNKPTNWITVGEGLALSLEALRSGGALISDLFSWSGCCRSRCCRTPLPRGMSERIILDEARLTALYVVVQKAQEIMDMGEGIPVTEELATSVLRLMDQTPIEGGVSITEHIVRNKDDL